MRTHPFTRSWSVDQSLYSILDYVPLGMCLDQIGLTRRACTSIGWAVGIKRSNGSPNQHEPSDTHEQERYRDYADQHD